MTYFDLDEHNERAEQWAYLGQRTCCELVLLGRDVNVDAIMTRLAVPPGTPRRFFFDAAGPFLRQGLIRMTAAGLAINDSGIGLHPGDRPAVLDARRRLERWLSENPAIPSPPAPYPTIQTEGATT